MTLREKRRLRWIVQANAREYRSARRSLVLVVMRGISSREQSDFDGVRQELLRHSMAIAEAVSTLEEHAEEEAP